MTKRMLETLVDYFFLLVEIFVIPVTLFSTSSLSFALFGCVSLIVSVLNTVTALIVAMWLQRWQRSDVNVTTGHVATFNNVGEAEGEGRGKRSNDDSEGANATLRHNRELQANCRRPAG